MSRQLQRGREVIRNRLVLAVPTARPATKMTQFTMKLLRKLGSAIG